MEEQFDVMAIKSDQDRRAATADAAASVRASRSENALLQMNMDELRRRLAVSDSELTRLMAMMQDKLGGSQAAHMVQ